MTNEEVIKEIEGLLQKGVSPEVQVTLLVLVGALKAHQGEVLAGALYDFAKQSLAAMD